MFQGKIFVLAIMIIASTLSCQKPKTTSVMKQNYFTLEGQKYVLKVATRNLGLVLVAPTVVVPELVVNAPQSAINTNSLNEIFIQTSRGILPVMMFYSVADSPTGPPVCDIATPYWFDSFGIGNFGYLKGLSKNLANVELLSAVYDPAAGNAQLRYVRYGIKYNQIVLSESDFINAQNSNVFRFTGNQYWAMTRQGTSFIPLPAGALSITQSVLYFELEKE